jgi:hypothetical protein
MPERAGGSSRFPLSIAGALERVAPMEWKLFDSSGWLFKNMNELGVYDEAARRLGKQRR